MKFATIDECLEFAIEIINKTLHDRKNWEIRNLGENTALTDWQIIKDNLFDMYIGFTPRVMYIGNKRYQYRIFFKAEGLELETTTGIIKNYSLEEIRNIYERSYKQLSLF